jgi:hypothetical protein
MFWPQWLQRLRLRCSALSDLVRSSQTRIAVAGAEDLIADALL